MMPASNNDHIVPDRLRYLFEQYIRKAITSQEDLELAQLALLPENEPAFRILEQEYWDLEAYQPLRKAAVDRFMQKIAIEPAPVRKLTWKRIAIAASILLLVAAGSYFLFFAQTRTAKVLPGEVATIGDISAPSTNRAVITLADGSTMYLDSMRDGQLATQGSVQVMKLANGKIAYKPIENGRDNAVQYNTLSNPRGSKVIDLTLADGSHVWLNAGSSVTYPVAFTTNVRRVSVTGEAYFEVAPDKRKPFQVARGNITVEVLGTHFNVNAYDDEPDMKVTLLEGSVRVSVKDSPSNSQDVTIKPGEQAVVANKIEVKRNADLDEVMAWKEGKFSFGKKTDLESIMRQLARWYNIEVIYQDPIDVHFGGIISRQVNVSEVLHKIELTGSVHFTINGDKIIVRK